MKTLKEEIIKLKNLENEAAEHKAEYDRLELEKTHLESAFVKLLNGKYLLTEDEASAVVSELDGNLTDCAVYEYSYYADNVYQIALAKIEKQKEIIAGMGNNARQIKVDDTMTDEEILKMVRDSK